MPIHEKFPKSPYEVIDPQHRWFPDQEIFHDTLYEKLLPPLVYKIRKEVHSWRLNNYERISSTSRSLLKWWFQEEHLIEDANGTNLFRYYFAQREAIETIIYLYEVAGVKDKHDLLSYDSSGAVSAEMFEEDWLRFVIKMATGSGKTKVMSLVIAWSYFHKLYEQDSRLSRNFLVVAPNIIVLDRLRNDFDGNKIFWNDPVIPDNGFDGKNWREDFQITVHLQDNVSITRKIGNLFLTNIHRVYDNDNRVASDGDENTEEYFLGTKGTGKTTDSKVDLGKIVREIDEIAILNDEAHHIHDNRLAWFKSIQDIHNRLLQKDMHLSLQIDMSATPKKTNGSIFVQTVCDYPLVEAIAQNVVKHPVLPSPESRNKLVEKKTSKYTEKYGDYIDLGVQEWHKAFHELKKLNKKSILFIMTDDTDTCNDVGEYLEAKYPELKGAVLVIHTKKDGEISESGGNELDTLRKAANAIDGWDSPYKAIVSVLMLKEGWDVRNVTTIVGLRAYAAQANILPEQTLGRGLRRMFPGSDATEKVSIIGTRAFMEFVESIKSEGVVLEEGEMGGDTGGQTPVIIEIDRKNVSKDLDKLDIVIPILAPKLYREYSNLEQLNPADFKIKPIPLIEYLEKDVREIVFIDMATGEKSHSTLLGGSEDIDYRNVIAYIAQMVMEELRLVSVYNVIYGKLKEFATHYLFGQDVDLENRQTLKNLTEIVAMRTILETFRNEINAVTIQSTETLELRTCMSLLTTRPFVTRDNKYFFPKKSVFNKIIGDSTLELDFAKFLERADDVIAYAKNYLAVHFQLDYVNSDGNISNYYPDFFVKTKDRIYIVETKGLVDLDVEPKKVRLKQWVADANTVQNKYRYSCLFVDEANFKKFNPQSFQEIMNNFQCKTNNQ